MQKYELSLILPGTLDDKEAESKAQEVVALVKNFGEEVELNVVGKNRLAYPINQIRYGYLYTVTFSSEGVKAKELQEKLRLRREILRSLVSKFKTNLTAQQKIAYITDSAGITRMTQMGEQKPPVVENPAVAVEQKTEKLDLEEINKKLDDLMGGDVVPGV